MKKPIREWNNFDVVNNILDNSDKISDTEIVKRIDDLEKLIAKKDEVIRIFENKILLIEKRVGLDKESVNENSEDFSDKEVRRETAEKFKYD